MSDFDLLSAAGPLAPFLIDPNSVLGLRWEGARAKMAGRDAPDNPFSRSHPGSLAQLYWWEGWWLEGQRAAGAKRPDIKAAQAFARQQKALGLATADTSARQRNPGKPDENSLGPLV